MTNTKQQEYYLKSNSIHYFDNDSKHMFVYNTSENYASFKGKKSVLLIPVNEKKTIKIPATKLPFDLTEYASKEDLVSNTYFMTLLNKKFLTICPDEEAFDKLSMNIENKVVEEESTSSSLDELFSRAPVEVKDSHIEAPAVESLDIDLTVLECINREDLNDTERLQIIKNTEDTLSKKDWEYILENGSTDLKAYATEKLN